MHKFYWHNNSHAGNDDGGGGGGGGSGSNRARPAGSSHGSSQPAATVASPSQRSARGGNSSSSSSSVVGGGSAMRMSDAARTANGVAPSVPHRNGVTVRVKTDGDGDDAKSAKGSHTPSGSHRVLLKLRRMSGGGGSSSRPKSVSDASEIPGGVAEIPGNSSQNPGNGGVAGSRMRNSRSMHQMFHYNKTWNERSLSKCLREEGQHNYENIYSGDKDTANEESDFNPLYENVGYPQYSQYPFVSLGNPIHDEGGSLVIGQLTKSPRSTARSRRKPQVQNTSNGNSGNSNNGLFRSKSCERPKMRDAVRETQQHLVSNFNRLLHNRFGVGGHSSSSNNNNDNSGSSAMTSSASMFMGGDNSSGYKSFHSGTDDLQPQVRKGISRDGRNGRHFPLSGINNGINARGRGRSSRSVAMTRKWLPTSPPGEHMFAQHLISVISPLKSGMTLFRSFQ